MTKQELHDQWTHRSTYHPPRDDGDVERHEHVNAVINKLGHELIDTCPDSRELSVTLDSLAITRMWAHAALAVNREPKEEEAAK